MTPWMTDLLPRIRDRKLCDLIIPGTHDSGSYGIRTNYALDFGAEIGPDADRAAKDWPQFAPKWSKAQATDFLRQLTLGARYLDLRVCHLPKRGFHFHHSVLSVPLDALVRAVSDFQAQQLGAYRSELVILHFRQMGASMEGHHQELLDKICSAFREDIASWEQFRPTSTVGSFIEPAPPKTRKTIIVIYAGKLLEKLDTPHPEVWPYRDRPVPPKAPQDPRDPTYLRARDAYERDLKDFLDPAKNSILTPYSQQCTIAPIIRDLTEFLGERTSIAPRLFVSQGVVCSKTINWRYLAKRSLKFEASVLRGPLDDWVARNDIWPRLNIVTADFVDDVARWINLNRVPRADAGVDSRPVSATGTTRR